MIRMARRFWLRPEEEGVEYNFQRECRSGLKTYTMLVLRWWSGGSSPSWRYHASPLKIPWCPNRRAF